ncbi:hypothetical protein A2480_04045 [Candidatus Uhrbacteria bacterium RIFOXYC2_FULL_47_19]|uniref:Uncharacterized protein n=1 Tax=Candidatus Uhrbacteria bacterium RIFOXYC2_FULL_47_19 TaxID=1802424 RepID=A0A1F7WC54_9BACT|nr:MAG: hypothetical protein A2480_04045 [Candidatus Uhrbacteria bacterium RIFOXYC2_FULL_47_19]HCC22542.1 hypothetical protein [Candidatus Uhrbacteria bacterium]
METKKIALACFVGGALCCLVALLFTPKFWYLGLLAGGAGGYLGYEFRQVLRAIPTALRRAAEGTDRGLTEGRKIAWQWLRKPHPFVYFGAVVGFVSATVFAVDVLQRNSANSLVEQLQIYFFVFSLSVLIAVGVAIMTSVVLYALAEFGIVVDDFVIWKRPSQEDFLENAGYSIVATMVLRGMMAIIKFSAWTLWKYVAISIFLAAKFVVLVGWHLFKLIHSQKRVLCAIDGTLGGTVSYLWLAQSTGSFAQQATMVIFGGLLGAAFGILNWEVVSKRVLHLTTNPS